MKILYISREDVPGSHGGSVHTWQVALQLARRGHQVTLVCHRRAGQARRESLQGVEVRRSRGSLRGRRFPILLAPALPAPRPGRFDLVLERYDLFGGLGAVYSRLSGAPLCLEVNYPHLQEMIWKWRQAGKDRRAAWGGLPALARWESWQYAGASLLVAPRASIVPREQRRLVRRVHWGADSEHFRPLPPEAEEVRRVRAQYHLGRSPVVIAHGSFRPWHGTRLFPAIIAKVIEARPDALFLFVGRGEGLEEIQRAVQGMGLAGRCRFTGLVDYQRMPPLLAAAQVALTPFSSRDYWPLLRFGFFWSPAKIFEYMASALPVVTSANDYLDRVVAGSGAGLCLPEGDAAGTARAVIGLLDDPQARRRMGLAGRLAVLERYSWARHAEQLEGFFSELIGGGAAQGRA